MVLTSYNADFFETLEEISSELVVQPYNTRIFTNTVVWVHHDWQIPSLPRKSKLYGRDFRTGSMVNHRELCRKFH